MNGKGQDRKGWDWDWTEQDRMGQNGMRNEISELRLFLKISMTF
jgi:hypothetical protein